MLSKRKKNTEERTEKKTRGVRPHFLRLLSTRGPLTLDPFLYSNLWSCLSWTSIIQWCCLKGSGYGLGVSWGCERRPAKLKGQINNGPKTQSNFASVGSQSDQWHIWVSFPFGVCWVMTGICHAAVWSTLKSKYVSAASFVAQRHVLHPFW